MPPPSSTRYPYGRRARRLIAILFQICHPSYWLSNIVQWVQHTYQGVHRSSVAMGAGVQGFLQAGRGYIRPWIQFWTESRHVHVD